MAAIGRSPKPAPMALGSPIFSYLPTRNPPTGWPSDRPAIRPKATVKQADKERTPFHLSTVQLTVTRTVKQPASHKLVHGELDDLTLKIKKSNFSEISLQTVQSSHIDMKNAHFAPSLYCAVVICCVVLINVQVLFPPEAVNLFFVCA